ncbi:MAG: type VI secretion system-associated FHA domain protein TagH [Gammaproteobacteria bacterium]|nr:type VI secretion system-associated FHA domain protein TagH [Gammaproteobacteria bacterium]
MALTLEIISQQRAVLGERARCVFESAGGNIGRALECDWVLPDTQRYVSSRHAAIDFRGGSYYLIDLSTNGVYVNDAEQPIGRGRPQRLFSGDRLRMGEYLMVAHIDDEDELAAELEADSLDPLARAQRVEAPVPPDTTLIDVFEMTGAVDLSLDTGEPAFKPGTTQPVDAARRRRANFAVVEGGAGTAESPRARSLQGAQAGASAERKPPPRKQAQGKSEDAADSPMVQALLRAAGVETDSVAGLDTETVMVTLGQLLRETVVGLREVLQDRSDHKATLGLGNTAIQPRENNPLKLTGSTQDALARLLRDGSPEYLPPVTALREAFRDIKEHQAATWQATHQAFFNFIEHLDPGILEERFTEGQTRRPLLPGAARARRWEQYAELYEALTRHAGDHFPPLYDDAFTEAYRRTLEAMQTARRRA